MARDRSELLAVLVQLRDQYGELFDEVLRQIVSNEVLLPDAKRSGRPTSRSEFILGCIWKRVEFHRQLNGENMPVESACYDVAFAGGLSFVGSIEKCWDNGPTIRSMYYDAKKLLAKDPALKARWEESLAIDLERARTGRSFEEILSERRPDWQREFLTRERSVRKSR